MTTPIQDVTNPAEVLDRINGYANSARNSLAKGNVKGAVQTIGFVKTQIRRFEELTK